jgi:hypothetical protein
MALRIVKDNLPVATVEDWLRAAPPAGGVDQWAKHKSAMTCAEVWLTYAALGGPPEVIALLGKHAAFSNVVLDSAEPEAKQRFDDRGGNTRNADLEVMAHDDFGSLSIAIEAKAGEAFGETVAAALVAGVEARRESPSSTKLDRVDTLARSILPARNQTPALGLIRYQLLTAAAGALAAAKRAGTRRAVLLIHEYLTPRTTARQHAQCARDLDAFVQRLSGDPTLRCGSALLGPFRVPGKPLFESPADLFIGKAQRNTRATDPGGT